MTDEDYALFQQAVGLANAGQLREAYDQFSLLRIHGNEDIELYFWIIKTTPYPSEAQSTLNKIALREPAHPSLHNARMDHERKLRQMQPIGIMPPLAPILQCPYCGTRAPGVIRSKVATGGWVLMVILLICFFPLCWIGLLIQEKYHSCSYCGARLG